MHRPRYDDWSWAKGKLDPGEQFPVAAAREVQEETGYAVRLGRRCPPRPTRCWTAPAPAVTKEVRYWAAEVIAGDGILRARDRRGRVAGRGHAPSTRLDYARDRDQLRALVRAEHEGTLATWPLALVRHAHAVPRGSWSGDDDRLRPLDRAGKAAGPRDRPAARGLRRAAAGRPPTPSAARTPWVRTPPRSRRGLRLRPGLSEEGHGADPAPEPAAPWPASSPGAGPPRCAATARCCPGCWTTCAAWPRRPTPR